MRARIALAAMVSMGVLMGRRLEGLARADEAVVAVVAPGAREVPRFAEPIDTAPCEGGRREATRAAVRPSLGAAFATTGRGVTPGLQAGVDLGTGAIGVRLDAAWLRAEDTGPSAGPLGGGLAQYLAEVTVDASTRGRWHPIAALGLGLARIQGASGGANAGVGTARVGVAYALPVEEADVRVALSVLGALPGPTEAEASALRGYALVGLSLGVGL